MIRKGNFVIEMEDNDDFSKSGIIQQTITLNSGGSFDR
jgi:hypothetical protein